MAGAAPKTAPARAGAVSGTGSRPRDPGRRIGELRSQGHSSDAIREQLRADGYSEATIANAVPGGATAPRTPKADQPSDAASSGTGFTPQGKPVGFSGTPAAPAYKLPSVGGSGSGVLIALVLWPAGLAFLRGGPAGVRAWFAAKFFNRVSGSPS